MSTTVKCTTCIEKENPQNRVFFLVSKKRDFKAGCGKTHIKLRTKGDRPVDMAKVLVVDDDPNICELLKVYLEDEFDVRVVHDGRNITEVIDRERPGLILLDVMLPGKNGFELCKEIRTRTALPIIFLTAKDEEIDKVLGLEFGADDYITKPFSPREMLARVKAVLRRFKGTGDEEKGKMLVFPMLEIDTDARIVKLNGEPVDLTLKEFEILVLMATHPGKVFTREQLLDKVWGYDYIGETRAVDSHVKRLRQKFEKIPGAPEYIFTVWGLGYKFEVPEN